MSSRHIEVSDAEGAFSDVQFVPIDQLQFGDSPRFQREDVDHVSLLVEGGQSLPPIVVHTGSNRVIDGNHRVRAALRRGETCIAARFFRGTEAQAFALAVRSNVTHGLPLTLAEREAAARRILRDFPQLSDRSVAEVTGLAATTIGSIRRRSGDAALAASERVGRDGRVRPMTTAEGRRRVYDILQKRPDASLRELARESGLSVGTARNVRIRFQNGEGPLPEQRSAKRAGPAPREDWMASAPDSDAVLDGLRRDPSLRFSDSGRALLRLLDVAVSGPRVCREWADTIPPHCVFAIADLARATAADWMRLTNELSDRISQEATTFDHHPMLDAKAS